MDEDNGEKLKKLSKELDELRLEVCRMESSVGRLWGKHNMLHEFVLTLFVIFILFLFRGPIWAFLKFIFPLILGILGALSFK